MQGPFIKTELYSRPEQDLVQALQKLKLGESRNLNSKLETKTSFVKSQQNGMNEVIVPIKQISQSFSEATTQNFNSIQNSSTKTISLKPEYNLKIHPTENQENYPRKRGQDQREIVIAPSSSPPTVKSPKKLSSGSDSEKNPESQSSIKAIEVHPTKKLVSRGEMNSSNELKQSELLSQEKSISYSTIESKSAIPNLNELCTDNFLQGMFSIK